MVTRHNRIFGSRIHDQLIVIKLDEYVSFSASGNVDVGRSHEGLVPPPPRPPTRQTGRRAAFVSSLSSILNRPQSERAESCSPARRVWNGLRCDFLQSRNRRHLWVTAL